MLAKNRSQKVASSPSAAASGKLKEKLKAFPRQPGETRKAWKNRSIQAVRQQNREAKGSADQPPYNIWGYTGDGPTPADGKGSDSGKGEAAKSSKGSGKGGKGKSKSKGKSKGKGKEGASHKPTWWGHDTYVTKYMDKKSSSSWDSSWSDSWKAKDNSWWKKSNTWDKWGSRKKEW